MNTMTVKTSRDVEQTPPQLPLEFMSHLQVVRRPFSRMAWVATFAHKPCKALNYLKHEGVLCELAVVQNLVTQAVPFVWRQTHVSLGRPFTPATRA